MQTLSLFLLFISLSSAKDDHTSIIATELMGKPTHYRPVWLIISGGFGAGKSTFTEQLFTSGKLNSDWVYVDADVLRKKLPSFKKIFAEKGKEAHSVLLNESVQLASELMNEASKQGKLIITNTTLRSGMLFKQKFIDVRSEKYPYTVILVQLTIDHETLKERVLTRNANTDRVVPIELVSEGSEISNESAQTLKNDVDGYIEIRSGEIYSVKEQIWNKESYPAAIQSAVDWFRTLPKFCEQKLKQKE